MGRDNRPYKAGLLHNMGTSGLFVAHPKIYAEVLEEADGATLMDREPAAFGLAHCEVGDRLAGKEVCPRNCGSRRAVTTLSPDTAVFDPVDVVRLGVLLTDALGFDSPRMLIAWPTSARYSLILRNIASDPDRVPDDRRYYGAVGCFRVARLSVREQAANVFRYQLWRLHRNEMRDFA
jgi:hypothetical protein